MKRLYYLTYSVDSTEQISKDLHAHGINDWRFHVVSKDEAGLFNHHVHSANILYRTDMVRFVERGVILGGLISCASILPLALNNVFNLPMGAWLAMGLFSMVLGAWVGCFGGVSSENYKIRRFHDAIQKGQYLAMIDAPKLQIDEIKALMKAKHNEAQLQLEDSTITNPFAAADGKVHLT